jgi:hypothetical protein
MNVVTLVPRRADGGHRDRLWDFARRWWLNDHPGPIIEGLHEVGPFNRSAALNNAAAQAGEWDVAVIIDADIIANPDAVRTAVHVAAATGRMVVSHNERVMLNKVGTDKVLGGYRGPWRVRPMVERVYTDSVSCCVAVPRPLWDDIGGFDERFVGWGHEDSAFEVAAETFTGKPLVRLASELYHLWHPLAPEAAKDSPTRAANRARMEQYRAAHGNVDAVRALLDDTAPMSDTRIPRILHRTVPADTSAEVEAWWARFGQLHPGWDCRTYREPLDPKGWPLTGDLWPKCKNGAQKAGLIRLEALYTYGGVYVDADVEPFRSLEPLLHLPAFAGWEDETTVPDAVLGSEPRHPAFGQCLERARAALLAGGDAWKTGPGVTTAVLPGRADVLVLPPGAFFPHHYLEKNQAGARTANPWVFLEHKWAHSWGSETSRQSIAQRQRA